MTMTGKRRTRSSHAAATDKSPKVNTATKTPKSASKRRKKKQQHEDNETSSFHADAIITTSESKQTKEATATKASNHNEIVSYITKFVSATKSSSSSEKKSTDFSSVISYLILFLQKDTTTTAAVNGKDEQQTSLAAMYITKEDVATLLLPWSVGRLMRLAAASSSNDDNSTDDVDALDGLAWAALTSSLDIVAAATTSSTTAAAAAAEESSTLQVSTSNETLLSSCFPQSTLNRLVPYAGRIAFSSSHHQPPSSSNNETHNIQTSASTTFVHLVQRYKSSFDVVCKTLLSDVDSLLSNNQTDTTTRPPHQVAVVQATLEKIHKLMENANPKRLFTIVGSTDVLPRLGRLSMVLPSSSSDHDEKLIQNILWDGLFHPVHHMDGFRTMSDMKVVPKVEVAAAAEAATVEKDGEKKAKKDEDKKGGSKTCFQAGLFQSVKTLLSSVTASVEDGSGVIATAKLLPGIVHGFFERVREHATQSKNGGSITEADAKLQFRFWCHLILPVLEALFSKKHQNGNNEDVDNALMDAVSQTLGLVLQYDAYLPSYNDPEEEHLAYLQSVADGLVRCVHDSNYITKSDHENYALVTSLCNLILLNHRLLHGKLSTVTYYTCSCLPQKNQEPNKLLFTIVKTYRELRAIGDFLTATREAFTKTAASQESADTMNNILLCNNVVDSLALAYQSCPSGQLQEMWNFFGGWIVDSISTTPELSFAVQMFIIFVKSIRSDKQNSLGLRGLCEFSMNSSIAKLLDSSDIESSIHMRLGFDLCGWLVELHSRSCFWVDNVSVDGESSFLLTANKDDKSRLNVLSYLHNTAETAAASAGFSLWKKSFLGAYWQSGGVGTEVDIGVHTSLRGSLQRLALHRIHQLHSMIYYCNLEESDEQDSKDSQSTVLTREAKMLVDFSFYIACSEAIGAAGSETEEGDLALSSASLWIPIAQSLPIWSHYSEHFHSELFLIWFYTSISSANSSRNCSHTSRREYATSIALTRDASFYDNDKIMTPLMHVGVKFATHKSNDDVEASSKALSFISSAPVEFIESSDSTKILAKILDLDVHTTATLRQSQNDQLVKQVLCSTRSILARVLSVAMLPSGFDTSLFAKMTHHLLSSSSDDIGCDMIYLSASSDAINECLSLCIDYYEKDDTLLQDFFSQLSNLIGDGPSSEISSSKAFLLRGVIRKLNALNRHHSLAKRNATNSKSVYDVCTEKVLTIYERTWRGLFRKISKVHSSACVELLLASELLSFHANCAVKNAVVKESTAELFETVAKIQDSSPEAEMITACNYFLSVMAAVPDYLFECVAQEKVFEQILGAMSSSSSSQTATPLLDAAFCSLIRHTDIDGLNTATTALIKGKSKRQSSVFLVKTFRLIISSIKSQEQQKYIAGHCEHFLLISMDLLREKSSDVHQTQQNVILFSRMMTTLLAKKELLVLIVSALIAHYSKQLYGCPSPLFGLLLSLLSHLLHTNARKGLSEKALEYSKLCELLIPHKDIFKKHVVGLILCYIKALSEGMSPITKKKLMPSVYALLDVCSDFETRQINAMIDVPSKTLFAPVFKSYQKFYQYHGQA
ncbi:unhealthy ribosome biogenesis protein 2-like protein [Skeletonema marinoi]|uniref:Unhealthy ribosome biogenesis protein 2-like protein n=1 Tax=Skeletonema marinoi TaxID=267567 RepID=A0AAD9DAS9_9STRA|nr:unhealthy ribosome biogenesis protein 2-like protein [Skeletonema marinoi]